MPRGAEPASLTRGLCLPTNDRTVSISTVPSGPSGLNGSPRKRSIGEEFSGAGWALTTGLANFLSPSISAHTLVVAGSMYPPKIIGLIGLPLLAASIATWMFPGGAANAFLPCLNVAAPAIEAVRSSRRFIGMVFLLELLSPLGCTRRSVLCENSSSGQSAGESARSLSGLSLSGLCRLHGVLHSSTLSAGQCLTRVY